MKRTQSNRYMLLVVSVETIEEHSPSSSQGAAPEIQDKPGLVKAERVTSADVFPWSRKVVAK